MGSKSQYAFFNASLLFTAFITYAFFGSPTPNSFDLPLALIGVCLVALALINHAPLRNPSISIAFLLYSVPIGLIIGGAHYNPQGWIIRDLIAFQFILLPFWLYGVLGNARAQRLVIRLAFIIGLVFSLRFLSPLNLLNLAISDPDVNSGLLYLANSPLVLFSALYALYKATQYFTQERPRILKLVGALCLSVPPIVAMFLMQQRASIACLALYSLIIFLYCLKKRPLVMSVICVSLLIMTSGYIVLLGDIAQPLLDKSVAVGLNMRDQEWIAVLTRVSESPLHMIFGYGWGGWFSSPAVGGMQVNFTHSLFSTYLLKLGLVGCLLMVGYLIIITKPALFLLKRNILLFLTLFLPFLIAITLYANFKSLGFGIILTMLAFRYDDAGREKSEE